MNKFDGVRLANYGDVDRVFNFLLNLNEENAIFPLSENRARESIKSCLDTGLIGVIENDKEIEGCIGLRAGRMWYTDEFFLDELWNFVLTPYRKSDNAKTLIDFAKWGSTVLGLPLVMGIVSKKQLLPKMRLYQRKMPQVGAYFLYGKNFEDMYQQRSL